jgi:hypothetical protein
MARVQKPLPMPEMVPDTELDTVPGTTIVAERTT